MIERRVLGPAAWNAALNAACKNERSVTSGTPEPSLVTVGHTPLFCTHWSALMPKLTPSPTTSFTTSHEVTDDPRPEISAVTCCGMIVLTSWLAEKLPGSQF